MTGTVSRIPRGNNPVGNQLEAVGMTLCVEEPAAAAVSSARRPAVPTTAILRDPPALAPTVRTPRRFSKDLVACMEDALRSGVLTLPELRFALQSATLRNEDDIRLVCEQTLRLKQAIIALGQDAETLMKRVHPHTVALLLRSWTIDQN